MIKFRSKHGIDKKNNDKTKNNETLTGRSNYKGISQSQHHLLS